MEQQQWQPPHPHIIANPHPLPPPSTTVQPVQFLTYTPPSTAVHPAAGQLVTYHPLAAPPPYYQLHSPQPHFVTYYQVHHYPNSPPQVVAYNHQPPQPVVFHAHTQYHAGYYHHHLPPPPPTHHFPAVPEPRFEELPAEEMLPGAEENPAKPNKQRQKQKQQVNGPVPKAPNRGRKNLPPRMRAVETNTRTPPPTVAVWRRKRVGDAAPTSPANTADAPPIAPANTELIPEENHTTVMIKNIPNSVGRDFMLGLLDEQCKQESIAYDFLYLPMDFRTDNNLGYAFVNFTTTESAKKFERRFHGFVWKDVMTEQGLLTSQKVCVITRADIQGKDNLVKRFHGSVFDCANPDYLPVVLDPPRDGLNENPAAPQVIGKVCRKRQ